MTILAILLALAVGSILGLLLALLSPEGALCLLLLGFGLWERRWPWRRKK